MARIWRLVVFLYSLLLFCLSGIAIMAAIGRPEPLAYINFALSTPSNRIIVGIAAIGLLVIAILTLISSFKFETKPISISVQKTLVGEVTITVAAIKVIILKAIKKIEGIKEVKTSVSSNAQGLIVNLHIMIDPELSVPETTKKIQDIVKQYLEEIGGLPVAEIRIMVDDFGTSNKQPAAV